MKIRSMQFAFPVVLVMGLVANSDADEHQRRFTAFARMSSFNEVPSIATGARGTFRATLNADQTVLSFELSWEGLSLPPAVAHVHLGQAFANGAVSFFLCGGGGQPNCPAGTAGSIQGTVTSANVMAVPAQGLQAGNLAQILDAMRRGLTYANIHTPPMFPGGECRGQVSVRGAHEDESGDD